MHDQLHHAPYREYEQYGQHNTHDDEVARAPALEITFPVRIFLHTQERRNNAAENLKQRKLFSFLVFFRHLGSTAQNIHESYRLSLTETRPHVRS